MSDDTTNTGKKADKGSKSDKKKEVPEIPPGTPTKPGHRFSCRCEAPETVKWPGRPRTAHSYADSKLFIGLPNDIELFAECCAVARQCCMNS